MDLLNYRRASHAWKKLMIIANCINIWTRDTRRGVYCIVSQVQVNTRVSKPGTKHGSFEFYLYPLKNYIQSDMCICFTAEINQEEFIRGLTV